MEASISEKRRINYKLYPKTLLNMILLNKKIKVKTEVEHLM